MSESVNILILETQLIEILSRVEYGEEFIISDHGFLVAKLIPYTSAEICKSPYSWKTS